MKLGYGCAGLNAEARVIVGVTAVLSCLVGLQIALPHAIEWRIERTLMSLHGYRGDVDDVEVQLWRGGLTVHGIRIVKESGDVPAPFFEAPSLEGSVQWNALFRGRLIAEGNVIKPVINFVNGPNPAETQHGQQADWREKILGLVPIDINRTEITDGELHYRDFHSEPPVDMYAQVLEVVLENLSNVLDRREDLPARLRVSGLKPTHGLRSGAFCATPTSTRFRMVSS